MAAVHTHTSTTGTMAGGANHIDTWEFSLIGDGATWQRDHLRVRLYPAASHGDDSSRPLIQHAPPELAPSQICVYEWTDYRLKVDDASNEPRVVIGGVPIPKDRDGFFTVRYENRLGRSRLQILIPGQTPLSLFLEVLSARKYPEPLAYERFYRRLLLDLSRVAVQLPFTVLAPTHMTVREGQALPSDLFAYHFLRTHAGALLSALARIAADPYRVLAREDASRPLAEASHLDSEVLTELFAHAHRWVPTPRSRFTLARRLGGQAPEELWQPITRDTYDSPENRFVLAFVRALRRQLQRLQRAVWWPSVPTPSRNDLSTLAAALQQVEILPLFAEVGEMRAVPAASKVLLLRDGYRELAQLWRKFSVARVPFFAALEEAIELRDVATLYESWCFYRLIEDLTRHFAAEPQRQIAVEDVQGVNYGASACWPGRATLVYNRTQRPPASYSLAVRPDFALLDAGGRLQVLFDAKFRFTRESWDPEDPDPMRHATREDLYTMHTYRDALGARAAVVLYPGDTAVTFDAVARRRREGVDLREVLTLEGIAALPLEPGQEA